MRTILTPVLAVVSDAWAIGFGIFSLVFDAGLGLALWWMRETKGDRRADDARLHELATKLVDERFRAMSHEVNGHVQGFMLTLEELKLRLKETEATFDSLMRAGHTQELKGIERLEQVKDYIRDQTASRTDLREHQKTVDQKFDRIMTLLAELQSQVAVVAERGQ